MSKRKYYNEKAEDVTNENITESESTEETVEVSEEELSKVQVEEPDMLIGIVTGCTRLNIRAEASSDSDILTVVNVGSELQIHVSGTTDEFFKVTTGFGIGGYAMRQFVSIN